jgi:hypothetical protein
VRTAKILVLFMASCVVNMTGCGSRSDSTSVSNSIYCADVCKLTEMCGGTCTGSSAFGQSNFCARYESAPQISESVDACIQSYIHDPNTCAQQNPGGVNIAETAIQQCERCGLVIPAGSSCQPYCATCPLP